MKLLKPYLLLILILLVAAVLRFWQLGKVPVSPDWDEAALGYNAYSILKTGRDEYGTKFPLALRSFDDYKPPLYAYLTIPSVALFGLNTWSVRLPSAIAGILAVLGTYLLVKELFKKSPIAPRFHSGQAYRLSLIASLLLAISPWHIQFSRIAFEANIGLSLNIWAVVLFLFGLTSPLTMAGSAFLFALGLYAYHSERIFVPLLLLVLAWIFRRELLRLKAGVVPAILVGLVTVAPLIPIFLNQNTLMRLRGTSILADQTGLLAHSVQKLEQDRQTGNPWGVVFDNRRIVWAKTILDGYLSHYSLRWLFLTGDNDRHHAPGMGLLYLWELPFLLYGIYLTLRTNNQAAKLLMGWFLIAPIAASPTSETPHAIRSLVFLPTFQVFIAFGITQSILNIKNKISNIHIKYQKFNKYLLITVCVAYASFIIFNLVQYLDLYFVQMNREYSRFWQYGYEQVVKYAEANRSKYKKIVVSTKLEQPHMFFLFFLKYDPVKYLAGGGTASGGFAEIRNHFDVYEFRPINWEKEKHDFSTLYIGGPREVPPTLKLIYYLDGTPAISIGE